VATAAASRRSALACQNPPFIYNSLPYGPNRIAGKALFPILVRLDGVVLPAINRIEVRIERQRSDQAQTSRQHHAEVCELIEGFLPEDEKAMPAVIAVKVNDIYLALSRAMDLPPAASWLDD
jgi:hypothetical protein